LHLIPPDVAALYEVREWRNAAAVLQAAHPGEWDDVMGMLRTFSLGKSMITKPGGNKSKIAGWVDVDLRGKGWVETSFYTSIVVDGIPRSGPAASAPLGIHPFGGQLRHNVGTRQR
ncbi:MAG: BglII/BstYI family type II restriction endonuclease, partial [Acidimicrobiales bacterium]